MHKSSVHIHGMLQDGRRILGVVTIFQSDPIFTCNLMEHLKNSAFLCYVAKSDGSALPSRRPWVSFCYSLEFVNFGTYFKLYVFLSGITVVMLDNLFEVCVLHSWKLRKFYSIGLNLKSVLDVLSLMFSVRVYNALFLVVKISELYCAREHSMFVLPIYSSI